MKRLYNILLISVVAILSCNGMAMGAVPSGDEPYHRRELILSNMEELWQMAIDSNTGFDTKRYFELLLEAAENGMSQERMRMVLERATQQQIRDPKSHIYGQLPRFIGGDTKRKDFDRNSLEFSIEFASLLRILYYDRLDSESQRLLDDFIDYGVYAMIDHKNVAVTYSNIHLMRCWNFIALGENLPSSRTWGRELQLRPKELAKIGYDLFDKWLREIAANGIHEHNSPTYTAVQAECLGYLARYTKNKRVKANANIALEYLSAMIFANTHRNSGLLAGVNSRAYYRPLNTGLINDYISALVEGNRPERFYNELALWEPTDEARRIIDTYPRTLCYRWGEDSDMNAVAYHQERFVIGSAGRHYTGNANEKCMTISLSNGRDTMLNIAHYFEGREDPYGKYVTSSGITRHLQRYAISRAQRDNEFVAMVRSDGSERTDTRRLASHIILPAEHLDEVWVGSRCFKSVEQISEEPLTQDEGMCFFLRYGDVAVGIRYLHCSSVDGKSVTPILVNENDSVNIYKVGHAMRLTAWLSDSQPAKWSHGTVVMWWRAEQGIDTDEKFAQFREKISRAEYKLHNGEDNFEVVVASPDGDLGFSGEFYRRIYKQYVWENPAIQDNKEYWAFRLTNVVGGIDATQPHFAINGEDIGRRILSKLKL